MKDQKLTRRDIIGDGLRFTLTGGAACFLSGCGQSVNQSTAAACADPNKLSMSENSLRQSAHYAEKSPDPAKTCSVCSFYTAGDAPCGTCRIFSGPTNAGGHCDSFAGKAA